MGIEFFKKNSNRRGDAEPFRAIKRLDVLDQIEAVEVGNFWSTDRDGHLNYLSPIGMELFKSLDAEPIGQPITRIFKDPDQDEGQTAQRSLGFRLRSHSKIANQIVRIEIADLGGKSGGVARWWRISGKPYFDANGQFDGYRGSSLDITNDYDRQLEAEQQSQYDPLTGLANRRRMSGRLNSILDAYKAAKRSCALMMLDLDRFKLVNDTLGHPAGDELLKQVAQRVESVIKKRGEIGRLGGDEFQIILPDIEDRGELAEIASRIIQMLSQPYSVGGKRANIGTSVGIAIAPFDGIDSEELNIAADMALYAAKSGGRGVYRFYSSELKAKASSHHQTEGDLRDALSRGDLLLNYQPLVNPKTDKVKGCEALLRWNHPELGPISPAKFIPIAEESDLIIKIGEWAMNQACMDAAQWPNGLRVAVNVSAKQFMNQDLPHMVAQALARSGLEPSRLELEITESVFVGDVEAVDGMFAELKKMRVRLALDDFGTGYSSLGYLNRAPFDKIKIDQSFVRGCTDSGNTNPAIISAIVGIGDALQMETVAEGVEAMDELALVRNHGVALVQGYIYSRPLTHDDLLVKLEEGDLKFAPSGPPKSRPDRRTVFRKIGLIHDDHYYNVIMRNVSKTGAWITGLLNVPKGTNFVLDLGEGQLAVAKVVRSIELGQGVVFESELIDDGAGDLVTRHRISPYSLAAAGLPLSSLKSGTYALAAQMQNEAKTAPRFTQIEHSAGD